MTHHASAVSVLALDEESLSVDELSMPALMREITLQQRPSWLLVRLMNALERRRQTQGMGWSRLLTQLLSTVPEGGRTFAETLLADPARLTFTFFHNHVTDGARQFEGFTLSFGRHASGDATKRDRLDLILEDERRHGAVDGRVDRLRLYICPWDGYGRNRSFHLIDHDPLPDGLQADAQAAFREGVAQYEAGKADEARQWSHRSQRYIEYFGPRQFIPRGSSFA